jgi:hypothetical protein
VAERCLRERARSTDQVACVALLWSPGTRSSASLANTGRVAGADGHRRVAVAAHTRRRAADELVAPRLKRVACGQRGERYDRERCRSGSPHRSDPPQHGPTPPCVTTAGRAPTRPSRARTTGIDVHPGPAPSPTSECRREPSCSLARDAPHGGDVAGIGAAASANERQVREPWSEGVLRGCELGGVAFVELGGGVELFVAPSRRVGS